MGVLFALMAVALAAAAAGQPAVAATCDIGCQIGQTQALVTISAAFGGTGWSLSAEQQQQQQPPAYCDYAGASGARLFAKAKVRPAKHSSLCAQG